MAKRVMILAAGQLQIPAIRCALDMGLEVITLDQNPEALGGKLAHHALPVNFMDKDAALKAAEKYAIDGVLTVSSDLPVPTVGYLCDQLGLTGISEAVGEICANKLMMRRAFMEAKAPCPLFVEAADLDEALENAAGLTFPVMVKPPDSSGSRGVRKAETPADIPDAFQEAMRVSRCGKVILEEFMSGLEFGAQAVVVDEDVQLIMPHNDTISSPPYYVPVGHSFPFGCDAAQRAAIERAVIKGVHALGITNSGVNLDFILTDEGPKLIEIGARLGGTCLPELVLAHTGVDINKAVIQIAIGEKPDLTVKTNQPVAALLVTSPQTGIVKSINIQKCERETPGLLDLSIDVKEEDKVNAFTSGPDRIGQVIVEGENWEAAEQKAEEIVSEIRIEMV